MTDELVHFMGLGEKKMIQRGIGFKVNLIGVDTVQIGIWIAIIISAIISFIVASFYEQPLHWYLFILIVFIGFFINTIILILKSKEDEKEKNET